MKNNMIEAMKAIAQAIKEKCEKQPHCYNEIEELCKIAIEYGDMIGVWCYRLISGKTESGKTYIKAVAYDYCDERGIERIELA